MRFALHEICIWGSNIGRQDGGPYRMHGRYGKFKTVVHKFEEKRLVGRFKFR
jgi:hypothetical protein